jgi:hypothetical protein
VESGTSGEEGSEEQPRGAGAREQRRIEEGAARFELLGGNRAKAKGDEDRTPGDEEGELAPLFRTDRV